MQCTHTPIISPEISHQLQWFIITSITKLLRISSNVPCSEFLCADWFYSLHLCMLQQIFCAILPWLMPPVFQERAERAAKPMRLRSVQGMAAALFCSRFLSDAETSIETAQRGDEPYVELQGHVLHLRLNALPCYLQSGCAAGCGVSIQIIK